MRSWGSCIGSNGLAMIPAAPVASSIAVGGLDLGGEEDHRDAVDAPRAQRGERRGAVELGHHHVEQDRVEALRPARRRAPRARRRRAPSQPPTLSRLSFATLGCRPRRRRPGCARRSRRATLGDRPRAAAPCSSTSAGVDRPLVMIRVRPSCRRSRSAARGRRRCRRRAGLRRCSSRAQVVDDVEAVALGEDQVEQQQVGRSRGR